MRNGVPAGVLADACAAARALLRIGDGEEAALLSSLCATAVEVAEAFTGCVLFVRGCEDVLAAGGAWQALSGAPVTSIAGLTGLPLEGAPFVLAVDGYSVDIDAVGTGWVRVPRPGSAGRVAVSYSAGLAAGWGELPASIAQGIAMLAAHLFAHREDQALPPAAVAALWRPWRRMRLMAERHA